MHVPCIKIVSLYLKGAFEMSHEVLTKIIEQATTDEAFRTRLIENMENVLRENNWKLEEEEIKALRNLKMESFDGVERSLDERISKALYGTDTHSILW